MRVFPCTALAKALGTSGLLTETLADEAVVRIASSYVRIFVARVMRGYCVFL